MRSRSQDPVIADYATSCANLLIGYPDVMI